MKKVAVLLRTAWSGTAAMPALMRMFCRGGMIATPVLLVALFFVSPVDFDGQSLGRTELWESGAGVLIATFLVLGLVGFWGLALRKASARWAVVVSPIAPYLVSHVLPSSELIAPYQSLREFMLAVPWAVGLYVCLFHIPSVTRYLSNVRAE